MGKSEDTKRMRVKKALGMQGILEQVHLVSEISYGKQQ